MICRLKTKRQRRQRNEPRGKLVGATVAAELRSCEEDGPELVRLAGDRALHRLCDLPAAQGELLQDQTFVLAAWYWFWLAAKTIIDFPEDSHRTDTKTDTKLW